MHFLLVLLLFCPLQTIPAFAPVASQASNLAGPQSREAPRFTHFVIAGVVTAVVLTAILIGISVYYYFKKPRQRNARSSIDIGEQTNEKEVLDEWKATKGAASSHTAAHPLKLHNTSSTAHPDLPEVIDYAPAYRQNVRYDLTTPHALWNTTGSAAAVDMHSSSETQSRAELPSSPRCLPAELQGSTSSSTHFNPSRTAHITPPPSSSPILHEIHSPSPASRIELDTHTKNPPPTQHWRITNPDSPKEMTSPSFTQVEQPLHGQDALPVAKSTSSPSSPRLPKTPAIPRVSSPIKLLTDEEIQRLEDEEKRIDAEMEEVRKMKALREQKFDIQRKLREAKKG